MRSGAIGTADGTKAPPDSSSLPVPLEPVVKALPSHLADTKVRSRKKTLNSGLKVLDSLDSISVELDRNCLSCRLDKNYNIRDVVGDKIILKGVQDFNPFNFKSLKNVIIRDHEHLPIARVSFKQKSMLKSNMALGVYAPCEVLAGTGEETSGLLMFSSKFILRNSDGDELFHVEYNSKILTSNFLIKSVSTGDESTVMAKVLEKSRYRVRLQITSKMTVTSKIILIGFCIALLNKFTPPNSSKAE